MILNFGDNFDMRALLAEEFADLLNTSLASNEGGENNVQL